MPLTLPRSPDVSGGKATASSAARAPSSQSTRDGASPRGILFMGTPPYTRHMPPMEMSTVPKSVPVGP